MPGVFVAMGSNVDAEENEVRAVQLLDAEIGVRSVSTFYPNPRSGPAAGPAVREWGHRAG
jgi:7,8-dihydro-6-hydroxymethylpterin-pyrophosphokinase